VLQAQKLQQQQHLCEPELQEEKFGQVLQSEISEDLVTLRVEAPGEQGSEVEVNRCWLGSDYFQAKLKRWSPSRQARSQAKEQEVITINLLQGCDPCAGAQIVKRRLACRENEELAPWSSWAWWEATDGKTVAFHTALSLFDAILLEKECEEVARCLELYRVPCHGHFESIARRFGVKIWNSEPSHPPVPVSLAILQQMLQDTIQNHDEKRKMLTDRAIDGVAEGLERDLVQMLTSSYLSLFAFEPPRVRARRKGAGLNVIPGVGSIIEEGPLPWLADHLEKVIRRCPECSETLVDNIMHMFHDIELAIVEHVKVGVPTTFHEEREPAPLDNKCAERLTSLVVECLHSLFIESHHAKQDGKRQSRILNGIERLAAMFANTFDARIHTLSTTKFAHCFSKLVSPAIFAVASQEAQSVFLMSLQQNAGCFLRGRVQFVHPEARHLLLGMTSSLAEEDVAFLSVASYPGLQPSTCPAA